MCIRILHMKKIYMYVMDQMADFEHGFILKGIGMQNMLPSKKVELCTFSLAKNPVKTNGGMTIVPDVSLDEVKKEDCSVLVLIGGEDWQSGKHGKVLDLAEDFLKSGITVAAICGATVALADRNILDQRKHTSNGVGFLDMFSKNYKGKKNYEDVPAVKDGNLITAACTGNILFAKLILEAAEVFNAEALDAWYDYFSTGNQAAFFKLMNLLSA